MAMDDPSREDIRNARITYYERAMRSALELVVATVQLMKVDELPEVVGRLGKAVSEIEHARAALIREHASSIIASKQQGEPCGSEADTE